MIGGAGEEDMGASGDVTCTGSSGGALVPVGCVGGVGLSPGVRVARALRGSWRSSSDAASPTASGREVMPTGAAISPARVLEPPVSRVFFVV